MYATVQDCIDRRGEESLRPLADDPHADTPAWKELEAALEECRAEPGHALKAAALAKAFETTFEYAWKGFKREAGQAGLEAYSPRDAIKSAGQLGIIEELEDWNQFLNARNLSVHDYIGMDDADMLDLVGRFRDQVGRLLEAG